MSTQDENKKTLRAAVEGWNSCKGGNFDCWLNIVTDDVQMRSLADGDWGLPFTRRSGSRDEVKGYLQGLTDMHEMVHYTASDYLAEGDRVVLLGSTKWKTRATGKEFETPIVLATRFRDGKICEIYEFYDTAKVSATVE